ncbi:MAG: ABC transporter ATP-binding protein [Oligoflexia bacterium]|nr:ABC transporter ATP-binding protein [Oligoflexia bacterium]
MIKKFLVHFKFLIQFTGPVTLRYLLIGTIVGVAVFLVEFVFAYVLQLFLIKIDLLKEGISVLPKYFKQFSLFGTLVLIFFLGVFKGFLTWAQTFLTSSSFEIQRDFQRRRLIRWAFNSDEVALSRLFTLFNDNSLTVGQFYTQVQQLFLFVPVVICLWLGLIYLSPIVTLVATLILVFAGFGFQKLNHKISKMAEEFIAELERINKRIVANMKNLILLQIYGTGQQEEERVVESLDRTLSLNIRYQKLFGFKYVLPQMLGTVLLCAITFLSVKYKLMAASVLLSYFYLFLRFAQNFSELVKCFSGQLFYWPQTKQMYQWWYEHVLPLHNLNTSQNNGVLRFRGRLGWNLKSVNFSYPGAEKKVVSNLNLNIKPGEFLAIVGPSGVGKSTILNLLLGLLKPVDGNIEIVSEADSATYSQLEKQSSLLKSTGYVGTESYLREGTLEENLLYGLDRVPLQDEIDESLKLAECGFIFDLPKGLKHSITDHGQGLSAGQKQRLALARALLRKPSVLILDEATSNLDQKTEESLVKTLLHLKGLLTIVAVTHRGSIAAAADRIFEIT